MPTLSKKNKKSSNSSNVKSSPKDIRTIKNQSQQKGTIKRRTSDLTLSKASATAIASQANHTRKEAIQRNMINNRNSSKKIPLRVWVFFWCSLLLFCISLYQAVIRPQLRTEIVNNQISDETNNNEDVANENNETDNKSDPSAIESNDEIDTNTATGVIQAFFYHLSNRDFDKGFDLFIPALQRSSEIREHFTAFRMIPFLEWIEGWKLTPSNFKYISTSTYWRDKYEFDLSYTLSSNQETYNETWEFVVDTKWENPKITNIVCTTNKCSYHPIFWPENFGMMR